MTTRATNHAMGQDEPPVTEQAIADWRDLSPDDRARFYSHMRPRLRRAVGAAGLRPVDRDRKTKEEG